MYQMRSGVPALKSVRSGASRLQCSRLSRSSERHPAKTWLRERSPRYIRIMFSTDALPTISPASGHTNAQPSVHARKTCAISIPPLPNIPCHI